MQGVQRTRQYTCARCLRASAQQCPPYGRRHASNANSPPNAERDGGEDGEQGALSRRLAQMSEESLETGGIGARNAVKEAGFSDDLKRELEEKIASASFRSEHASAFAEVNMPSGAGRGTRDIAAARPWMGSESVEDAALRMLTDAHKPMRVHPKIPGLRGPPVRIDTGRPKRKAGTGTRLVNARDKTSIYASLKDSGMSEQEREKLRQEMKQRFQPDGRAPATVQGLANLANQRIEDAIARGQFKNLPRGKKIERDHNASSPFIDTTEYFMNKIIQKQEIVPPWIEKQQEVLSTVNRFRKRLRADWRRHVARTIASKGGGLERQMKVANEYALAEMQLNPAKPTFEQINTLDSEGQLSQITLAGELKATPVNDRSPPETVIKVVEQAVNDDGTLKGPDQQVTLSAEQPEALASDPSSVRQPTVPPFRDPQWEQTEGAYLRAAVDNINSMTRSYNLMAPDLAKKPYFSLDRELKACFADVAPTVAGAIRERALAPKIKGVEIIGHKPGGVLEKFSMDRAAHVHDERKPQYGFKDFWRDLFASKS